MNAAIEEASAQDVVGTAIGGATIMTEDAQMLVTMRVLQWQTSDVEVAEGYTAIALDASVLASGDLEPQSTIEWEAPPMSGEYMLDLMSVYENEGHIGYGWHILVE